MGILIGIGSVGAVGGSLATGHFAGRLHAGWTITLGLVVSGFALLGAALSAMLVSSAMAAVFVVAFVVNGFTQSAYNVFVVSLRQSLPPARFLAAATAAYRLVSFGTLPIGSLAGGALATALGPGKALVAISTSLLLCSTQLIGSPVRHFRTLADHTSTLPAADGDRPQ